MKCVYCGGTSSRVIDSRQNDDGTAIRRRRECESCGRRFTTYEKIETTPLMVIKKDGTRQAYDSSKIKAGLMKACEKRPVSLNEIDSMVHAVERKLQNSMEQEFPTSTIGDIVMELLREVDEVAYVRYASVHRQFKDINTLLNEIEELVRLKDQLGKDNKGKK